MRPTLVFILFLLPRLAWAGLEDSGEKKVTVGSEIKRGYDAVTTASYGSHGASALNGIVAMGRAIQQNVQTRTDTPGFLLGARYGMWSHSLVMKEVFGKDGYQFDSRDGVAAFERGMEHDFDEFQRLQKELGISEEEMFRAMGFKTPESAIAQIRAWENRKVVAEQKVEAERQEAVQREILARRAAEEAEKARRDAYVRQHLPELVKASQARALAMHPELGQAGSAFNKRFLERYQRMQAEKSNALQEPNWPELLADQCAANP